MSKGRTKKKPARDQASGLTASSCTIGDFVVYSGQTWRLTAINQEYGLLRESDKAGAMLMFVTPDTQFESREPYVPRVGGGGVDPLTRE